ncbi:hypothetical protein CLF_101111 [Clonorchis sinensis]|uniref:Uncharacterized protein n=1 Tax=Clonorchis sinensis TaxID=79923 RepID=G7Y507_CLOSI|nr:hypothetical protein CLF_101111 [Clonorchis sinensis]
MRVLTLLATSVILKFVRFTEAVSFVDCGSRGARPTSVDVRPCNDDPCTLTKGSVIGVTIGFMASEVHKHSVDIRLIDERGSGFLNGQTPFFSNPCYADDEFVKMWDYGTALRKTICCQLIAVQFVQRLT